MSEIKRGSLVVAKPYETTQFVPWYDSKHKFINRIGVVQDVFTFTTIIAFGPTSKDVVKWSTKSLEEYTGDQQVGEVAIHKSVILKDMLLKAHELVNEIAVFKDSLPAHVDEIVAELDTLLHDAIGKV